MSDLVKMTAPFRGLCPACGRIHSTGDLKAEIGSGVIKKLPEIIKSLGTKPFVLADPRTFEAAGKQALDILSAKLAASGKFILLERGDLASLLEEAKKK